MRMLKFLPLLKEQGILQGDSMRVKHGQRKYGYEAYAGRGNS